MPTIPPLSAFFPTSNFELRTSNSCPQLIVFARPPLPGQTKTRLIPALGAEGAANLQRQLIVHTLLTARRAARRLPLSLELHYAEGQPSDFTFWLGPDLFYRSQSPGDLGDRMRHSIDCALAAGCPSAILIGTDVPGITEEILRQALRALDHSDLVLGPALDGGYYLIALRHPAPALFSEIPWGTNRVLELTRSRAASLGLSTALLPPLSDIDRPEDFPVWERIRLAREKASVPTRLSIIIPTRNEANNIAPLLANLLPEPGVQVIVADGGSSDSTRSIAASHGATAIEAPPGRAAQMNAGARMAAGENLLFLHADTRLPDGFSPLIHQTLRNPAIAGGAFSFRLDRRSISLRLIEIGTNLRSRLLQLPYGDQGLFLRTETFRRIGGFPDVPILEDLLLVRRLRTFGRIVILQQAAVTSARRWQRLGACRTTFIHQGVLLAHALGASPARIRSILKRMNY